MIYDDTNSGALFKNEKQSDKHPDYKGSLNVEGKDYWVSSWVNESQAGKKYLSLKLTLKEETNPPDTTNLPSDEDLPF